MTFLCIGDSYQKLKAFLLANGHDVSDDPLLASYNDPLLEVDLEFFLVDDRERRHQQSHAESTRETPWKTLKNAKLTLCGTTYSNPLPGRLQLKVEDAELIENHRKTSKLLNLTL